MRVWHSPWSWLKLIVAAESVAGNTRIGMFTSEILRNPFQVGRAAMEGLSTGWRGRATRLHRIARRPPSPACGGLWRGQFQIRSELIADLKLKHARRGDVGRRRPRVGRGARRDHLAERRVHRRGVAIRRLGAAEDVAVVQQVEALDPE